MPHRDLAFEAVHHGSPDVVLGAEATDDDDPLDDISLPSDDDLEVIDLPMNGLSYLTQTIQDLVKDLYKLSFRIRNSTTKPTRAIHYKEIDVSSGLEIFGDCYAALDKKHIFELFRSLRKGSQLLDEDDDVLIERLARSNTARRRQFRYWQKHAQKFTPTEPLALVTVNALALEPVPESVKANPDPKVFANTHVSESHHSKTILTATEATHFDPQLDLTSLETQSITSFATTARDLEGRPAELPPPPAAASNNRDFVCPYCYVLCPARHDNGRAWRLVLFGVIQLATLTRPGLTLSRISPRMYAHTFPAQPLIASTDRDASGSSMKSSNTEEDGFADSIPFYSS